MYPPGSGSRRENERGSGSTGLADCSKSTVWLALTLNRLMTASATSSKSYLIFLLTAAVYANPNPVLNGDNKPQFF